MTEKLQYDTLKMVQNYQDAKSAVWNAWIDVRKTELVSLCGITFEMAVTSLAEDIKKHREQSTNQMINELISEIEKM